MCNDTSILTDFESEPLGFQTIQFHTQNHRAGFICLLADPLDVQECQAQLRMRYNTMNQVKITPWDPDDTVDIDDIYTNLSWLKDERKPTGKRQRRLEHYTEIFEGHKRFTNPKRILVYGRPGIGKSTFSQKVAVDWASGKNETLKRFDLLLLIKLRDVCGIQDFPSMLKASEVLACDGSITIASLHEYVVRNQDKVLVVLDGYDEYSPGTLKSSPIREIWEGNQLRDCHVVVTTRQMKGEELIKSSHVQCEIKGLDTKEQVNEFACKFIPNPREIEEFNGYLDSRDMWEIAEIPLLLLMLCLIWMDRHRKALPKSRLNLHERFVETLLSHMAIKNPTNVNDEPSYNILDEYREELSKIGELALEGLLRNALYIDLKDVSLQSSSTFTDKMVRSGLFQFSKLSSADPYKSLFFLHKSIQEFLAAWFIMNEAGLTEGKVDCFARIDSFQKALHLQEILKFMCEWSEQGARAVFSLLKFIGEKGLTKCRFTKTPSVDDLSSDQRNFRYLSLQCFFSCSSSAKKVLYPLFLSNVGGVVLVNTTLDARNLAAEDQHISSALPSYVFFEVGVNFADIAPLIDAWHVVVVTCSGLRLEASIFFRDHWVDSGFPKLHFFLKKQEETVHFYFTHISWKYRFPLEYLETMRDLTTALPESQKKQSICDHSNSEDKINALNVVGDTDDRSDSKLNCLSLIISIEWECNKASGELCVLSGVLSAVAFPRSIEVTQGHFRLFDAQVVKNMVSDINITDNLYRLQLKRLNLAPDDATILATSLHRAPNLHELELSDSPLYGSVNYLVENLYHAPRLVDLTLFRVGMGYQECISLGTSLKHLPELQRLILSYNSLGDGITKLAEHFRSVPRLTALGLGGTNMGEEEATCLAHSLKHVSNLEELYLRGNPLGRGVSILVQHLRNLPNLSKLDLENVVMTKKELDDVTAASREKRIKTSYHVSILFLFSLGCWSKFGFLS